MLFQFVAPDNFAKFNLYIIEKLKSFFDYKFRLQMESGSRDFWQGDGLVASPENSHF